ncbi:FAD-dependent oxidoreductase [Lactonifactor longoviformis]|uniref:oxidoreductase n=1 Tax=Lactonifactor longoviformis TaxID=341220 RepID=UPI0021093305|nr:FAD-dependent oxidoreductase [Lactonifactor longoviformis]MCQ4670570.1 FAD-dependent oxidoreductase [Lactonifactor longoviformis]
MEEKHKILFEPVSIGKVKIKNRYVMAPMGPGGLCDEQGCYNQKGVEYYVRRAQGGTGLIMTGVTYVENDIEKCVMPSMPCPTINPLNFIKTAKPMTERLHAYGAKIFSQLSGGFGRVSIPSIVGKVAVAPSPIPHRFLDDVICRELTVEEIHTYVKKFAEAAAICKRAGFDGVEIHAVHEGYLIDQFAISFYNHRTDEYGGSLVNRLRFATEIVQAIKEACGEDYPVSLRYSLKSFVKDWRKGGLPGEEFTEAGRDIEEGKEAARILADAGYDALNADVGTYDSWYWNHPPMYHEKGMYLPYNEILKQAVDIPVITAGRMENPDLASDAVRNKQTDMVALGRPLLADPDIPNKIMRGEFRQVRPCLSCQEGCMGRLAAYAQISCAVNPACGRENEYGIPPALHKKQIWIVGGGVAGMEAARVSALRGHEVTLYEKSPNLGGNLIPGGAPSFKEDDHALIRWYELQLKMLGVHIQVNTAVSPEELKQSPADEIILATGSKPKMLSVPGAELLAAEEVLTGKREAGASTVVIGGGLVGCETALWLKKEKGTEVTIVELQPDILSVGGPLCSANSDMLRDLLVYHGVEVLTGSCVTGKSAEGCAVRTPQGDKVVAADTVICAVGYASEKNLYEQVREEMPYVHLLGDAEHVSNIMYAVWNAYELARNL